MNLKLEILCWFYRRKRCCEYCGKITIRKTQIVHFFANGLTRGWVWTRFCRKCRLNEVWNKK